MDKDKLKAQEFSKISMNTDFTREKLSIIRSQVIALLEEDNNEIKFNILQIIANSLNDIATYSWEIHESVSLIEESEVE